MADDRSDFERWLEANPPPDLQMLVEKSGGYNRITPEAWATFDADVVDWQQRRLRRLKWA
jgi:hypothetical protein